MIHDIRLIKEAFDQEECKGKETVCCDAYASDEVFDHKISGPFIQSSRTSLAVSGTAVSLNNNVGIESAQRTFSYAEEM